MGLGGGAWPCRQSPCDSFTRGLLAPLLTFELNHRQPLLLTQRADGANARFPPLHQTSRINRRHSFPQGSVSSAVKRHERTRLRFFPISRALLSSPISYVTESVSASFPLLHFTFCPFLSQTPPFFRSSDTKKPRNSVRFHLSPLAGRCFKRPQLIGVLGCLSFWVLDACFLFSLKCLNVRVKGKKKPVVSHYIHSALNSSSVLLQASR